MKSVDCAFASSPARAGRIPALRRLGAVLAVAGTTMVLAGCSKKEETASGAPGGGAPVVEVGIFNVQSKPLTLSRELPGRTTPHRVAEVRARVDGIVTERLFEEGAQVKEGQVLYRIDPAPYQAQLASAEASLARAEANHAAAEAQVKRYKELVERRAVSRQEYDDTVAKVGTARADIAAAKAAVAAAQIDLDYTEVTAPIAGRIGRSEVTEGAYVQRAAANLMATIRQLDPIYVDVTQSSEQMLRLKDDLAAGRLERNGRDEVLVSLLLPQGEYSQQGVLQFAEVNVNESTSSVMLRALFPNEDGYLLPGMFVRARVPEATLTEAIVVPQRGVSRDNRGNAIAYVVGEGDVVELRQLELDRVVDGAWLVASGLDSGDRLIVEGLQRIRPGVTVKPVQNPPQQVKHKLVDTSAANAGQATVSTGQAAANAGQAAAGQDRAAANAGQAAAGQDRAAANAGQAAAR